MAMDNDYLGKVAQRAPLSIYLKGVPHKYM